MPIYICFSACVHVYECVCMRAPIWDISQRNISKWVQIAKTILSLVTESAFNTLRNIDDPVLREKR